MSQAHPSPDNKISLPDTDKIREIISALKSSDLSQISYHKIINYLLRELKWLPFTSAKMNVGHSIFRARVNISNTKFTGESEISYRNDIQNITQFGRANPPGISLFYGAITSEKIDQPRIVNLFETSELFRNISDSSSDFFITVGKWRVKSEIEVVEVVFNKNSMDKLTSVKDAYNHHLSQMQRDYPDRIEDIKIVLEFFSDEFAKKNITSHHDYKISAAYADLAMRYRGTNGLVYPSVRTDAEGMNIVLTPSAVENFLELELAGMFQVYKRGDKSFMDNAFIAEKLGPLNSKFEWTKINGTNPEIINEYLLSK